MTEKTNARAFVKNIFFVFAATSMYFVSALAAGYALSYITILLASAVWAPAAFDSMVAGVTVIVFISMMVLDLSILVKKTWSPITIIAIFPYLFYKTVKTTVSAIVHGDKTGFRYEYEYDSKAASFVRDVLEYIDSAFHYFRVQI